jgi:hypothetical protein
VTPLLKEKEQAIEGLVHQFRPVQEGKVRIQNELKPLRIQVNEMKTEAEREENKRKDLAVG